MKVLITGGAGFLGQRLARRLLERGTLKDPDGEETTIGRIVLLDNVAAQGLPDDPRLELISGDITDGDLLEQVIDDATTSIFHLAAVVSGQAEVEFDLGMRVNFDASRQLLEVCRRHGRQPRVLFTSSVAVYGGALPDGVADATALRPQSSYGTQKALAELLLFEYSRRGFVDGRVLRLPTVSIRPGRPNRAASSFASAIVREPLTGETTVCPVEASLRLWLMSPRTAIDCLVTGHELAPEALGGDRAVNLPGVSVSVGDMVEALRRAAGDAAVRRIRWQRDKAVERIVGSWPGAWDTGRARALGFPADENFDSIIRAYIDDDLESA